MTQHLPLRPLQLALYDRLTTHPSMSGHTVRDQNTSPEYPYCSITSVSYSDSSTDSHPGVELIAQIDAWGLMSEAGDRDVAEILDDVTEAITSSAMAIDGFENALAHEPVSGTLARDQDPQTGQLLSRGVLQYRFTIFQQ